MNNPTSSQWRSYQDAWQYFNDTLFAGELKPCLLNFSRHRKARGLFAPKHWIHGEDTAHEISLNPDEMNRPIKEILSTLVHEMVHQWQQDCGTPPKAVYHNGEWADKMESIGLMPSHTGQPDGRRTGRNCSHYIIDDGPFDKAFL